ncbi:hypothetical protein GCM10020331_085640 [Ectobacillus funiculus]
MDETISKSRHDDSYLNYKHYVIYFFALFGSYYLGAIVAMAGLCLFSTYQLPQAKKNTGAAIIPN